MVTAFVRINIVLILLRQALGSPQVPGNQVLTASGGSLLTALVMHPLAEKVYQRGDHRHIQQKNWISSGLGTRARGRSKDS